MIFKCPVHGTYEIDLERGQNPPKWCVIYKDGTNEPCGEVLKRIYTVPSIKFVGSGFYTNDK
jgi:hypothetical protein